MKCFECRQAVETYSQYFDEHSDVLEALLQSIKKCLDRLLPVKISDQIDREGCKAYKDQQGIQRVCRHPSNDLALSELIDIGLFRIFAPSEYGGFELPVAIYYLAVALISEYDTSLALVFLVHGNALYTINKYGTKTQREVYLPRLVSGEQLATIAFTEPLAGSDAGLIRTKAVFRDDRVVLSGTKQFITNGGDADILVTTARTGPLELGISGVSTFILEREVDGVELTGLEDKTALNGSPTASLVYPDIEIPADRLLGELGRGGHVMFAGVGMTRINIGAQALGLARRSFKAALQFACEREQGHKKIIEHKAIQRRLADVALDTMIMEHLVCWVSHLEFLNEWHVREISIVKYFASDRLQTLTSKAINVLGGYGVCREFGLERARREAVALPLYGGTSEIHWKIISTELIKSFKGRAKVDYGRRDREAIKNLQKQAKNFDAGQWMWLISKLEDHNTIMWKAVELVVQTEDPEPCYFYLAEMALNVAAHYVLLRQAIYKGDSFSRAAAMVIGERCHSSIDMHFRQIEGGGEGSWLAEFRDEVGCEG